MKILTFSAFPKITFRVKFDIVPEGLANPHAASSASSRAANESSSVAPAPAVETVIKARLDMKKRTASLATLVKRLRKTWRKLEARSTRSTRGRRGTRSSSSDIRHDFAQAAKHVFQGDKVCHPHFILKLFGLFWQGAVGDAPRADEVGVEESSADTEAEQSSQEGTGKTNGSSEGEKESTKTKSTEEEAKKVKIAGEVADIEAGFQLCPQGEATKEMTALQASSMSTWQRPWMFLSTFRLYLFLTLRKTSSTARGLVNLARAGPIGRDETVRRAHK